MSFSFQKTSYQLKKLILLLPVFPLELSKNIVQRFYQFLRI